MEKKDNNTSLLHDFNKQNSASFFSSFTIIILFVTALLGIGTGYLLSSKGNIAISEKGGKAGFSIGKGAVVGSDDLKTFKDPAEGVLRAGGIEGEGQFHLIRPGGDSQSVYMTSSLVDLSLFEGKKIKVWGQTQKAQTAGWLMDVGKVEVLE